MSEDIKDIAQMMGERFAEAVRLSEKLDGEEIESINKSQNEIYTIFMNKLAHIQQQREKLLEQLIKLADDEHTAATGFYEHFNELAARQDAFAKKKYGTPVSDEAVVKRANGLGGRVS